MRKLRVLISALLCLSVAAVAMAAMSKLSSVEQLKFEKLAAQRGTVGESIALSIVGENLADRVITFEKYVDAIASLSQGKVRAVIMDQTAAKRFVDNMKNLAIMPEVLSVEEYAIGFKKGSGELVAQVNKAIAEMQAEGSLDAIRKKYLEDNAEVKPEDIDLNKGAKGGKLVMGTEAGFAPYEIKVGDGYVGLDIELCAEIAKKLDKELVIENMNFDALPMAVNSGKVDMICAGITVTEDRKQNMDFSAPYGNDSVQVALVRADDLEAK